MKIKINPAEWPWIFGNGTRKGIKVLLIGGAFLQFQTAHSQSGEEIFKTNCAACHTVGDGKLVGPDLQGVTTKRKEDWLLKFIKSSQTVVKSGDADANAIFNEFNKMVMPDQALSDAQIKSILTFIASKGEPAPKEVKPENTTEEPVVTEAPKRKEPLASVNLAENGRLIFDGSIRLQNGGASCITCHHVSTPNMISGGTLAKDLTKAYSRLGGEPGIKAILSAPPFPAMGQAYKDKPLTEEEISYLTAFLGNVDAADLYTNPAEGDPLLVGGFSIFLVLIVIIALVWFNKKNKMVKQEIYDRQTKASN